GSCTAMIREGYHQLGLDSPLECYEVGEFLVKVGGLIEGGGGRGEGGTSILDCGLGIAEGDDGRDGGDGGDGGELEISAIRNPQSQVRNRVSALSPPPSTLRVAFHRACHGRG